MPDRAGASRVTPNSDETFETIVSCVESRESFVLEAGAGAGKTYSLVQVLRYLIENLGLEYVRRSQQVACITYTNAARDEIESRLDSHPAVWAATIHSFCWSLIGRFQDALREELPTIGKWQERLDDSGGLGARKIIYDIGIPTAKNQDFVSLSHDDVIELTSSLMKRPKFRSLIMDRYPIILIDEYQDTDSQFVEALKTQFLSSEIHPLLGFFGDHWQMIYRDGCGFIDHPSLRRINKHINYRSGSEVINVLNQMRPALVQFPADHDKIGNATAFHTNDWPDPRLTKSHWKGDLPPDAAHRALESVQENLRQEGWVFDNDQTKILMLTHNVLAEEQGYRELAGLFTFNDSFLKKEDPLMKFFADTIEPSVEAFANGRFGHMMELIHSNKPTIRSKAEKLKWSNDMKELLTLRNDCTIGEVLDHLQRTRCPRLPEAVESALRDLERAITNVDEELPEHLVRLQNLKNVRYSQVISLVKFINGYTPFATKHGVKGLEFEDVLVIVGRGWNLYDFNQMLEWAETSIPAGKEETFERSRNLLYVTCSRPRLRLAVLFTQELSAPALTTLNHWFGTTKVLALPPV